MTFNKHQTGLALGSLFGLMHLTWVIIVGIGGGQYWADKIHNIHFINDVHSMAGVSFGLAFWGVLGALVTGYICGWIFAWLFNSFSKK